MSHQIRDLHRNNTVRDALLQVNNASAQETSLLTREKFDRMIASARVATFVAPAAAFLLAFARDDDYDGVHFHWFRERFDGFLYVDRIVVAARQRGQGLGQLLYNDLFGRAAKLGHATISCEVNLQPPNPASDKFHAALGFMEVGQATTSDGAKTVRYLLKRL